MLSLETIILFVALAFALFLLGVVFRGDNAPKVDIENVDLSRGGIVKRLNESQQVADFGSKFASDELEKLFDKSKNPWGVTYQTFNFVRYGVSSVVALFALLVGMLSDFSYSIFFFVIAFSVYYYPKYKYESIAKEREASWNKLYQYMWVIKSNLSMYDARKTFLETADYISEHSRGCEEIEQGLRDFAEHWNSEYMDSYIKKTYGYFDIPNKLFSDILNAELTGTFPEGSLNSLREIIIERMNFHVEEVLSNVGSKATLGSTPFLMGTVFLITLSPAIIAIVENLG